MKSSIILFSARISLFVIILVFSSQKGVAQISPGELTHFHANLEGLTNCTKCHTLGDKVSNDKCLDCHKEISERNLQKKGFHSSSKVLGKTCTICHSEHFGKNYDIVHLVKDKFDHNATGYKLEGAHAKKNCEDCHKSANIKDADAKKKKMTYLGLSSQCLSCHEDFHQKLLPSTCLNCHTYEAFKPASKFNHANAKFQLKGKHAEVLCEKCHKKSVQNGKDFYQYTGLQFKTCVNCHKDPHDNRFGQNCSQCHSEESFKSVVKGISNFDHSKTGYPLTGKHLGVVCKSCHKVNFKTPLKHEICSNCHSDYHKGQLRKNGIIPDCKECHSIDGFTSSSYGIEKHNLEVFKLEGGHLSTPCIDCHKKQKDWKFKEIGSKCVDCHKNIHKNIIDEKYYPAENCESCHSVAAWNKVNFDHKLTSFVLQGKHAEQSCKKCHFKDKKDITFSAGFGSIKSNCENCHKDNHNGQFKLSSQNLKDENDKLSCLKCHGFDNWKAEKFDHSSTRFKLDGGHKNVACAKCHKLVKERNISFINYKFKEISCASCHSHS